MGGRRFDSLSSKKLPECVQRMAEKPPACFDKRTWTLFLVDCYRGALNRPSALSRMNRGEVPAYCGDCTLEHAQAMQACMKCRPPVGAVTPFSPPTDAQAAEAEAELS